MWVPSQACRPTHVLTVLLYAPFSLSHRGTASWLCCTVPRCVVPLFWPCLVAPHQLGGLQVLMVTRSRDAAERTRALRVVQGVVDRVQENYLLLVPEMLPFLSELLEDPDIPIVARTQQLLKHLEQLSGEDLTQYMKH